MRTLTRLQYCGNELLAMGATSEAQCSYGCAGDYTEYCGGPDRLSLYHATTINVTSETGTSNGTASGDARNTTSANTKKKFIPKKFPIGTDGGAQGVVLPKNGSASAAP